MTKITSGPCSGDGTLKSAIREHETFGMQNEITMAKKGVTFTFISIGKLLSGQVCLTPRVTTTETATG